MPSARVERRRRQAGARGPGGVLDDLHAPQLGIAPGVPLDRQELLGGERLPRCSTQAVPALEARRVAERRKKDHRYRAQARVVTHPLQQAIAVDLGHHDVGNDEIGNDRLQQHERAHPRVRGRHLIALTLEDARRQQPHLVGIVNDQNMGTHALLSSICIGPYAAP
jgi:hypothetical protein